MIFRHVEHRGPSAPSQVRARCPACLERVTLESLDADLMADSDYGPGRLRFGNRRCPNPTCHAHLFVVRSENSGELIVSYPPERIDFDATDIPQEVTTAFEEAIACHSQSCFVASAVMVRKTLEEVCRERQATGPNLKGRIKALGGKVVLPQPMLDALDNLRLLGNDAAHVESQEYAKVDKEEVEVAIDVTKEILKATYQYESIMGRLEALKKEGDDGG